MCFFKRLWYHRYIVLGFDDMTNMQWLKQRRRILAVALDFSLRTERRWCQFLLPAWTACGNKVNASVRKALFLFIILDSIVAFWSRIFIEKRYHGNLTVFQCPSFCLLHDIWYHRLDAAEMSQFPAVERFLANCSRRWCTFCLLGILAHRTTASWGSYFVPFNLSFFLLLFLQTILVSPIFGFGSDVSICRCWTHSATWSSVRTMRYFVFFSELSCYHEIKRENRNFALSLE